MKKFQIVIPVSACVFHEIEAESEEEAIAIADALLDNNEIDMEGYDYEGDHWLEEL